MEEKEWKIVAWIAAACVSIAGLHYLKSTECLWVMALPLFLEWR